MSKFRVVRRGCAESETIVEADNFHLSHGRIYFYRKRTERIGAEEVKIIAAETWTDIDKLEETNE